MARDRVKREFCAQQKNPLTALVPEDLTFQHMRKLHGDVLPLRDVTTSEPAIAYLANKSKNYQNHQEVT